MIDAQQLDEALRNCPLPVNFQTEARFAYQDGWAAFLGKYPLTSNPHIGTDKHMEGHWWDKGWMDSMADEMWLAQLEGR